MKNYLKRWIPIWIICFLVGFFISQVTKAYNMGYWDSIKNDRLCRGRACNYFALHRGTKEHDLWGINVESGKKLEFLWRIIFDKPIKWIDTRPTK